jgi:hypothetical protein
VVFLTDEVQRVEAYKRGELDEIGVTAVTLDTVASDSKLSAELLRYPSALTVAIGFNNVRKPFDVRMRLLFASVV